MSTVTAVPTVELSNVPPRVRLDVTDTGTPNLFAATVTRLDPDGVQRPVRTTDGNPLTLSTSGSNRVGLVYDYEAPYGQAVTYSTLESPGTVSAAVTVDETRPWLVHPGIPALSLPIRVGTLGSRSRKVQRGVHFPMGRKFPVVVTDGSRKAAEYQLTLVSLDDAESAALEELLDDAAPLLLNVPVAKGWRLTFEYVAVGDVEEERPSRIASESLRSWVLLLTVIDRPAGGTQAQRTYVDLLSFGSYADLQAAYADYSAVLAGP